jgi:DNA-binding MarR family transcriptional regulator
MRYTEILIDIRKIVRSINLESKRIQKTMGISIPQLLCLNYLNEREDHTATQKEITLFLHLNRSTVTGIISRLEKKKLLSRLPKVGDKRTTYVSLTPEGIKLLIESHDLLHDRLNDKLSQLSKVKVAEIKNGLDTLVNLLEIESIEASPLITSEEPMSPKEI